MLLYLLGLFLLISLDTTVASYNELQATYAVNVSQASYCVGSVGTWDCKTCNPGVELYDVIENGGVRVLNAFDYEKNLIIVSFRGSSNTMNWLDNLQVSHCNPYQTFSSVSVEKGFYKALSFVREPLYDNIYKMMGMCSQCTLLITGHSLGGALSTLAAFELVHQEQKIRPENIQLITFGSPRVGNDEFKELMQSISKSWRITHYYDIVPHVPEEFLKYIHISQEIWYNEENTKYVECDDLHKEDKSCSDSCAPTKCTSTSDHADYLHTSMGSGGC